jgi:hypothetical protein
MNPAWEADILPLNYFRKLIHNLLYFTTITLEIQFNNLRRKNHFSAFHNLFLHFPLLEERGRGEVKILLVLIK